MRVLFLAIVALATAECAQIVGVLLVFTLMVGPAGGGAAADRRVAAGVALAAALALAEGVARHHARVLHRLADAASGSPR